MASAGTIEITLNPVTSGTSNIEVHIWSDGRIIVECDGWISAETADRLKEIVLDIYDRWRNKEMIILNKGWKVIYHDLDKPRFSTGGQ